MRGSSASERPPLIRPAWLLVLAGTVAIALWTLSSPRRTPSPEQAPIDDVALAWLRSALATHPDDTALRLRLARSQQQLSLYDEASWTVEPLLRHPGLEGAQARLITFEGNLARWRQEPKPEVTGTLGKTLEALLTERLPERDQESLLRMALELGRPDLAARGAEHLAEVLPERRKGWLQEAGRQWLAAGEAARAAESWAQGAEAASEALDAEALAAEAMTASHGMRDGGAAVALVQRLLTRFPKRKPLLERALAVALAHQALSQADRWSTLLADLSPLDEGAWRRRREVALAAGDLAGALAASRKLVQLSPRKAEEWRWLARIAGWTGDLEASREAWRWLALREGSAEAVSQAVHLATQARDFQSVAEVLESRRLRARLTDTEFLLLVNAYEHLGEPSREEALLRARGQAPWLRRLAALQEQQGRFEDALATWKDLEHRSEAPEEERRKQGELLWRLGRAPAAMACLRDARRWARPEAAGYWRLLAELAWNQEADTEAREAYQVLQAHAPPEALVSRRLVRLHAAAGWEAERKGLLAVARGHYEQALSVDGRDGPSRLGLLRLLLRLEDLPGLTTALSSWRMEAERTPEYFEPYARALWRLGQRKEATAWFGRWAQSHPEEAGPWLEYAQSLHEVGERTAASKAFAVAVPLLRPQVASTLDQLPSHEAVQQMLRLIRLSERHGPPALTQAWAEALQLRAAGDADVQDWALTRALAREDAAGVRHWLAAMRRTGRSPPAWLMLRQAMEAGDGPALSGLLKTRGTELSLPDRVFAERWLGNRRRARQLLTSGSREGLSQTQNASLDALERELAAQLDPRVNLLTSFGQLGPLASTLVGIESQIPGPGESLLHARVSYHHLGAEGFGTAKETQLQAGATLGPEQRPLDLRLGLAQRGARLRPSWLIRQQGALTSHLRLVGEAAWGEASDETALLRLLGQRHRLAGTLFLKVPGEGEASAAVAAQQYRTLKHSRLGEGLGTALQVSWPWALAQVQGRLGLTSAVEQRWLRAGLPPELAARVSSPATHPLLPERAGSLGLQASMGSERSEEARSTYLLEAWGGWLWPETRPGYHLKVGGNLRLAPLGELSARFVLGSAWGAGTSELHRVLELGWRVKL
ncbi:tetratricopeptide repeat protein [Stigmatella aurantiaca]|uniref:Tetratricopeptide repeat family n=1 Tax=Stigmatella aurantiaca (strain DW4/3-1) TaxID=378806 RepID=Q098C5_STIAD|nr:tetratricopeptide repeat protein [Stigmatella aurantiaca]ADO71460.1 Tetratricopeptide repeat family [Stigmatella aurantiaca DW4/3-1]EAU68094.1 tetratricopeptide repeat family [Stigmatella aurantiaca DW4/3-1]